ncbi:MAG: hypothetical protein WC612_06585 [Bdellovibrionales bacterium]|jgi:hypothetical protein
MEVLFEYTQIGAIMKVTAVDAQTGTEVVIQGPASMPQSVLQRTALTKLRYVLDKKGKETGR